MIDCLRHTFHVGIGKAVWKTRSVRVLYTSSKLEQEEGKYLRHTPTGASRRVCPRSFITVEIQQFVSHGLGRTSGSVRPDSGVCVECNSRLERHILTAVSTGGSSGANCLQAPGVGPQGGLECLACGFTASSAVSWSCWDLVFDYVTSAWCQLSAGLFLPPKVC